MRIARFDTADGARYGALVGESGVRLVGEELPAGDIDDLLDGCEEIDRTQLLMLVPTVPSKLVAVGRNFAAHADEMQLTLGEVPSVFLKPLQCLLADGGDVVLPPERLSRRVEHEAELAIVIGRTGRSIPRERVHEYVLGFTCANDVSARDVQRSDPQLTRGKGFDTFCPLGPWIETAIDLDSPRDITCRVNGELRQQQSTAEMLFDIRAIVEFVSDWTTLVPGDVILTGSPVGSGPLVAGDHVEIEVEGVGVLRHGVVASDETPGGW